jgi:hypothetical protein
VHFCACRDAAHHASREHANDLARDNGLTLVIDPDFASLVLASGFVPVRWQKTAGPERHAGDTP